MDFGLVSIFLLVIATLMVLASLKLLIKNDWFLAFLRGFVGFSLLLMAYLTLMSGINIASYAKLAKGETIANISFKKISDQRYQANLVNVITGKESSYTIDGDLWQVDSRIMRLALSGPTPFYKLDRISGRYYSIEQETSVSKSAFELHTQQIGFDLWSVFKGSSIGLVSADYGSATFMPMAEGALFAIMVGPSGLLSKPINDAARTIVDSWE